MSTAVRWRCPLVLTGHLKATVDRSSVVGAGPGPGIGKGIGKGIGIGNGA